MYFIKTSYKMSYNTHERFNYLYYFSTNKELSNIIKNYVICRKFVNLQ